jgi:hypothetical protein
MDTRFWGPSGWKLLHHITYNYNKSQYNSIIYEKFFEIIPYILPCKYCRASLTDYYRQHPFDKDNMQKWLYTIHNCVNHKLRDQGLNLSQSDPKFKDVTALYKKMQACNWNMQLNQFWDFLFAVAYNHPAQTHRESLPLENCPRQVYECNDNCEKNKWNILSLEDRLYWFYRFWNFLPAVLPLEIAIHWEKVEANNPPTLLSRRITLAWLWRMRCGLDRGFKDPYTTICRHLSAYSSNCGKKKQAITCRRGKIRGHTHKNKPRHSHSQNRTSI